MVLSVFTHIFGVRITFLFEASSPTKVTLGVGEMAQWVKGPMGKEARGQPDFKPQDSWGEKR